MFFPIEDEEDTLLVGTVVAAQIEENEMGDRAVMLTYNDGRRVLFVVEAFGLVMQDLAEC
jgi:hypothetical protein